MSKEGLPFATLMIVVTGLFVIAMLYFSVPAPIVRQLVQPPPVSVVSTATSSTESASSTLTTQSSIATSGVALVASDVHNFDNQIPLVLVNSTTQPIWYSAWAFRVVGNGTTSTWVTPWPLFEVKGLSDNSSTVITGVTPRAANIIASGTYQIVIGWSFNAPGPNGIIQPSGITEIYSNPFNVTLPPGFVPPALIPSISSINLATATIGSTITLHGSAFLPTGNTIAVNGTPVATANSSDGETLTFQVPSSLEICTAPGCYAPSQISVSNSNGISNFGGITLLNPVQTTSTLETVDSNQITWLAPGEFASTTLDATYSLEIYGEVTFGLTLNKVGIIQAGEYKGGTLVMANSPYGRGKGMGIVQNIYRFVLYGNSAILLPQISNGNIDLLNSLGVSLFSQMNMHYAVDGNFSIPALKDAPTITVEGNPTSTLTLGSEQIGTFDPQQLILAFTDPVYGNVYTTNPAAYLSQSFYNDFNQHGPIEPGINLCQGSGCFKTNGFFIFRPDGTFLMYGYEPNFDYNAIRWNDGSTSTAKYTPQTVVGCSDFDRMGTYENIVPMSAVGDGADLTAAGTNDAGDTIYTLSNPSSSILSDFYNQYVDLFTWFYRPPQWNGPISWSDFLTARPVYFWYDPFGRLVRFENESFLPIAACEPVVYLYPISTEQVHVQVSPLDGLTAVNPAYDSGWSVIASPNGAIYDSISKATYPYLFWEGLEPQFPISPEGFVVRPNQIHNLFLNVLPKLGLNQKEVDDFMTFWEPKLQNAPYYFITFYTDPFVDSLAPLNISPEPDTVIRVLMDFEELQHPISVQPPHITTPQRNGFTVVEWGGLERPGWVK